MSKGVSLSDEGADELTKVLLETGYGNDSEIANTIIKKRPEVLARIYHALNENDGLVEMIASADLNLDDEDDYYDPEELIA